MRMIAAHSKEQHPVSAEVQGALEQEQNKLMMMCCQPSESEGETDDAVMPKPEPSRWYPCEEEPWEASGDDEQDGKRP